MLTKTITIGDICFTVHAETGRDVLQRNRLLMKLSPNDEIELDFWWEFLNVLARSTDVILPFPWPELSAAPAELLSAREAWLDLPGAVITRWRDELRAVNESPGDADLQPVLPIEKKETLSSLENGPSSEPELMPISQA